MQQLTGLDTSFLNIESRTTYGHIAGLAIFDPSLSDAKSKSQLSFDSMKALIRQRLHLLPPYRRRLVEVPLGIDHPYWIEDPDFDLDFHVRHIGLPPPGNAEQLADLVSRICARPLDRSRPLWEFYYIEGLEGGLVAQLSKIHHCAIDGVSGAELLTALLDTTPEPRVVDPPKRAWLPDSEPTQVEMALRGLWSLAGTPRVGMRLMRETARNLPAVSRSLGLPEPLGASWVANMLGRKPDPMLSEAPTTPPKSILNGDISQHRRFAYLSIPLDEVKEVKKALGVTLNDVVMGMCAGALRNYLKGRSALPEAPLVAMVPVSVRTEEQSGSMGNQVASMTASLHTDLADPVERMEQIHRSMAVAKERHKALPATLLQDFAQFAPPAVAARAARVAARATVRDWIDVPFNLIISNVPGPQFPLYGAGAKLVANYPVSAINDGVGLNITVQSYNGALDFGLIGCRERLPDIWLLSDELRAALDELLVIVRAKTQQKPENEPEPKPKAKTSGQKKPSSAARKAAPKKKAAKPAARKKATRKQKAPSPAGTR